MELIIGICGCTKRWHRKLEGKRLTIRRLGDETLDPPLTLTLTEARIPEEGDHVQHLEDSQCQLFLDVDPWDFESVETRLERAWIVPEGYFGLSGRGKGMEQTWIRKNPPPTHTILAGIKRLIEELPRELFEPWIAHLPESGIRAEVIIA